MKIKLSATFEGKCTICDKSGVVFTAGDEDTKKAVTICKECSKSLGDTPTAEVIEKYGKVDSEPFEGGKIRMESLDKIGEQLKSKLEESKPSKSQGKKASK
jgi:transcription elongation factor Elf1